MSYSLRKHINYTLALKATYFIDTSMECYYLTSYAFI